MPGPRGVIIVKGKDELHLGAEDYTAALTTEVARGTCQSNLESIAKLPDTNKGV